MTRPASPRQTRPIIDGEPMNGEHNAGRPGPAASGAPLFIALAAVASIAVGLTAANAGLWLVVIALVIGWARWAVLVWRVHYVLVPRCLAEIALDERWKDPDWDASEALIHLDLVTTAQGNMRVLARARRRVEWRDEDLGRRTVALGRLDAAMLALRESSKRSSVVTRLLTIIAPTSWAVGTGSSAVLLLSETTPGPVLAHPWRVLAGLVAAGATGSLVTRADARRRSRP